MTAFSRCRVPDCFHHNTSRRMYIAARRFSILGIVSVVALMATGAINVWILVGSFHALIVADYGARADAQARRFRRNARIRGGQSIPSNAAALDLMLRSGSIGSAW